MFASANTKNGGEQRTVRIHLISLVFILEHETYHIVSSKYVRSVYTVLKKELDSGMLAMLLVAKEIDHFVANFH